MVQVDIFWSYGLGAGLALAGQTKLKQSRSWWESEAFLLNIIWTACVFAPSGVYLLWSFPGWETMFVATNHASIPAWLVTLFALTNVTQSVLGFAVTAHFLKVGRKSAAIWQTVWSHLAMLFILVVGWDGTGFRRFLYAGTGEEWHAGVQYPWTDFFSGNVFYALLLLGVFFIPSYWGVIYLIGREQVSDPTAHPANGSPFARPARLG